MAVSTAFKSKPAWRSMPTSAISWACVEIVAGRSPPENQSAAVTKHPRGFVVGRPLDTFDKEMVGARFRWISLGGVGYATIANGRFRYAIGVPNGDPQYPPKHTIDLPGPSRRGFPAIHTMSYTITVTPRERHLSAKQRRALEILAAAGLRGCTGATLLAHGFSVDMLADLVHDGLATAHRETMRVGRRKIQIARMRITDAGRTALEG